MKTFGATLASIGITWLAGEALSLVVTGINNLVHASEKCSERVKELSDNFKSEQDSITQHQSTISSIRDRYVELSKGVNNLGQNVSLTTDEFTEYNKICNQIADMFPTLVQGYDSQGNAILKYKANVEELNKALLEEKKNSAAKIINNKDDILDNYENTTKVGWFKKFLYYTFDRNDMVASAIKPGKDDSGVGDYLLDSSSLQEKVSLYRNLLTKSYEEIINIAKSGSKDAREYSILKSFGVDKNTTEQQFAEFRSSLQAEITTTKSTIDEAVSGVKSLASSYLLYNDDYTSLSDEQISIISSIINNIDDKVANSFDGDEKKIAEYVNNIVDLVNNSSPYIKKAFTSWFTSTDTTSDDQKVEWLDAIIEAYENKGMEIPVYFIDAKNELNKERKTLENRVKDLLKVKSKETYQKVESLSLEDLKIADELNVPENTYLSWDELVQKINEAKQLVSETEITKEKTSFKQAWKDLGSTDDDALKNTQKDLLALAQTGKLTKDSFKKTDGATTWIEKLGLDVDEVIQKIYNLKDVDETQLLSSLKSGVKLVQDAFADKRDNGVAGADTLNSMESEFGKLKSWKKYKETLGSTTSTLNECRDAQNKLASEYVNNNNFLVKLVKSTGEVDDVTKAYYTSQLKELGIKNAKDVVDQQILNRQNEIHQKKSEEIIDIKTASTSLADATQDEIDSLIKEVEQLDGNTDALKLYLLQKMMSKDDALDTEDSVKNLISLAEECDASKTVVDNLKNALKNLQENGNVKLGVGIDVSVNNPISGTTLDGSFINNGFPTLNESFINQQNNKEQQNYIDTTKSDNEKRLKKENKKLKTYISTLLKDADKSNTSKDKSKPSKSATEFNWVDRAATLIERKAKNTVDRITDYASKKTKNKLFDKALNFYGQKKSLYSKASDFYLKKFNNVKLDNKWKTKIKNGDISIDNIKNEKLANRITKAQNYYDKYLDFQDKKWEAQQAEYEMRKKKLDDDIAYIDSKVDKLQSFSDSTQASIDYNDTLGVATSENSYKQLIKYSKKQVKRWEEEKATYMEFLSHLKKGSAAYADTKAKIADCDTKIRDAQKSQLEWNQTISKMPLTALENFSNILSSIISGFGQLNSLLEAQNKKLTDNDIKTAIESRNSLISSNQSAIEEYKGTQLTNTFRAIIKKKYGTVHGEHNLDYYASEADPIAATARSYIDQILAGTMSLDSFYSEMSKSTGMTIDFLKQSEGLTTILNSITNLNSDNYSLMQEQEEYTDKLVDNEIQNYQDLIDEMNKANDAKQKAIELTEKEIALQKALENRTNLIYRNGKYVYESDSSAVKEAKNNLDDYFAQRAIDKLQEVVDKLEDLKNDLNYRDGTRPLFASVDGLINYAKQRISEITRIPHYAKGTTSAKGGLSLTGENGTELRVLNRGDGIIPAEITKNLMEFGVDPAKIIMDNLNKNIPDYKNIITPVNTSTDNSIHIDKVEMSGVNDVQSFMKELSHLTLDAQQRAYKR